MRNFFKYRKSQRLRKINKMTTPGMNGQLSREEQMSVYKTIFDTWRSQVDSSWQRSTYFAAFEIAALGGCWLLVSDERRILPVMAGILFSIGGLFLTYIWLQSTRKTQVYVRHWWDSIRDIEAKLSLAPLNFAQKLEDKRNGAEGSTYSDLMQKIPILFVYAWGALALLAIVRLSAHCAWHCCAR